MSLVVISTHPIQYQAPVYRSLQTQFGVSTTVIYGSDFSVSGYRDREFGTKFAWDTDLLSGYTPMFLSRVAAGGAASAETVTAKGISAVLRQLNPSAILLLGYRFRFDLRVFFAGRRTGAPLLFRAEAADHNRQRSKAKQLIRDTFLRGYYRQFERILYIGQNAFRHYQRLGCRDEQLIFSPYCVDTTVFKVSDDDRISLRESTRAEYGIASNSIVILFSGKLVPRKAPQLLIEAVQHLPAQPKEKITLVFLGDGELRPSLEQAEGSNAAVRFVGFQNQTRLSSFYHAADMLVMPSLAEETWGLVVNEALHHGLPCLVSDRVGCAPDLIKAGVTGEIFAAGSSSALAEAIQRGLAMIGKEETRQACRTLIDNYRVEKAAEGIAQAYREVVN